MSEEDVDTREKPYRANRKKFFLTYSQSGDLTREEVLEHLKSKGDIKRYLIALEKHKDGEPHIHAFVEYRKERNFKNCRWGDIRNYHGYDGGRIRDESCVTGYCSKEEDFITNFFKLPTTRYEEAILLPTYEECIDHIKKTEVRDFMLFGERIKANAKEYYTIPKKVRPRPEIELRPDQVELIEKFKTEPAIREIIWIWSKTTGAGKSTFYEYVKHEFNVLKGTNFVNTMYVYNNEDIIWFDVPRQRPLDAEFTSMLEDFANQTDLMSTKYKPEVKTVISHIVVTCNRPPPHDKLPGRLVEYNWNDFGAAVPEDDYIF